MSENLNPRDLMDALVEKHESFLKSYEEEYDSLRRIDVLSEKVEQLDFWIKMRRDESGDTQKKKDVTKKELDSLTKKYSIKNPQKRMELLKGGIKEHKIALEHWNNERRRAEKKG
ncbi:MAG: hypothetical protein V1921_07485 [Candidatus Altiarchaeota archaeon]